MFKQFLISSSLIASSLIGSAAVAAPAECIFYDETSRQSHREICDYNIRRNSNGHKVTDFTFPSDSGVISVVYWTDRNNNGTYAELFIKGKRIVAQSYVSDGNLLCVRNNNVRFCFQPL